MDKRLESLIETAVTTLQNYIDGYEGDHSKVDVALKVVLQYMKVEDAMKRAAREEERDEASVARMNRIEKILTKLGGSDVEAERSD